MAEEDNKNELKKELEGKINASYKNGVLSLIIYVLSSFLTIESLNMLFQDKSFINYLSTFLFSSIDIISFYKFVRSVIDRMVSKSLIKKIELLEELDLPKESIYKYIYKKNS